MRRVGMLLAALVITSACGETSTPEEEALSVVVGDAGTEDAAAQGELKQRFTYARCINGCWRADNYCRRYQTHEYNCPSKLGDCFDWCDEVLLGE